MPDLRDAHHGQLYGLLVHAADEGVAREAARPGAGEIVADDGRGRGARADERAGYRECEQAAEECPK